MQEFSSGAGFYCVAFAPRGEAANIGPVHDKAGGLEVVSKGLSPRLGQFETNRVAAGDCLKLIPSLPDSSIDVVVTSPPYWGQRISNGVGIENDPRTYLKQLTAIFVELLPKLKDTGVVWVNIGDSYNTPVNWRLEDRKFSSLGPEQNGLHPENSAYVKPRLKRKAFIDSAQQWLQYGNLLALPQRLVIALSDSGYVFRGEVIWKKRNPMPEGKCRRPHRQHEAILLFAKSERHEFRTKPPVRSVWEFSNEKIEGPAHYSRFPEELPRRCIDAYGLSGPNVVVLDPFAGSGSTGIAAVKLKCSFVGFEIDAEQVSAANARLQATESQLSFFRE